MSFDPNPEHGSAPADLFRAREPQPMNSEQLEPVLTRSEEELRVGIDRRQTRRARLIKSAETEERTFTIAVRREQVQIEYLPISDADAEAPTSSREPSTNPERWLVLYDEEVVVETRWVPRERVRLAVHTVVEEHKTSETLAREEFELDDTTHGG